MSFFTAVIGKIAALSSSTAPQLEFLNTFASNLKRAEDYGEADELIEESEV